MQAARSGSLLLSTLFQHHDGWQCFTFNELKECAAASRDVVNFVSDTKQIDRCQGVAAACDRETFAVGNRARHNLSSFTEVRELEHANRTIPQNGFSVFD